MARTSKPNQIKVADGTATFNKKSEKTITRDSGGRVIKPSVEAVGTPKPPKTIKSKGEKDLWNHLVIAAPWLSSADEKLMAAWVHLSIAHDRVVDSSRDAPVETTGSTGQTVINPAIRIQAELASKLATLGARLGLDPVSRNNITTPEKPSGNGIKNPDFWGLN